MANENISLYNLLNLSISSPRQGVVNFRAMYALLQGILRQLNIRDITVSWSDTCPEESSPEQPTEQGFPDTKGAEEKGTTEPGPGPAQDAEDDKRQVLELIHKIQIQNERVQNIVKELRLQQDKAAVIQSEWVKTVESLSQRVEALEQAEKGSKKDEHYVTWEAMKSALVTERENLKKGLFLTKDSNKEIKDRDATTTALDSSDTSSPAKPETADDSRTGAEIPSDASQAPTPRSVVDPSLVPSLKNLSQKVCSSSVYMEAIEALRDVGQLKHRCDGLEERLAALDQERSRDHQELLQFREILYSRGSEDVYDEVQKRLEEQKSLVRGLICERDKCEGSDSRDSDKEQGAEWSDEEVEPEEPDQNRDPQTPPGLDLQADPQVEEDKHPSLDSKAGQDKHVGLDSKADQAKHPQVDQAKHPGLDSKADQDKHPGLDSKADQDKHPGLDSKADQDKHPSLDLKADQDKHPGLDSKADQDKHPGLEPQADQAKHPGLVAAQVLEMDHKKSPGLGQEKKPQKDPGQDLHRSPDLDLFQTEIRRLKKVVSQLRMQLSSVEDSVKELRDRVEAAAEETNQSLQEQLDALRGILQQMMESLTSQLSLQEGPVEEGSELSGVTHTVLSLGSRLTLLFREHEQLQDTVSILLQQQPASGRDGQARHKESAQLVSGVQKAILHLQSECEKLHETTRYLHEDNRQKQTHIEELYKTTEELEEKKADKNMVETEIRADKSALESKVSRLQFDSVTEQLSNMFNELLTKITDQEQDWSKVMEKLSSEMDCKLNRIELDSVKKQLEARWKSIQERMRSEGELQQDDAAGIRKQLVERFHCLSCDRHVFKHIPGPQMLTLPTSPGFQPNRSIRPFTVYTLEQIRQHYGSLRPGTNRLMHKLTNISGKREQLQKSYHAMCRQIDRLRENYSYKGQHQGPDQGPNQGQSLPERLVEVADYSLYSVSRSCGGSNTVTPFTQRHRNPVQHGGQQTRLLAQVDHTLGQSEEVDIVGLDGHIYKGRLNTSLSRNAESKLPTIPTKDGPSRSRGRPRSSLSPRESAVSPGQQGPSPPSGSCSGRDWPVSALGCTSQSSIVPMSVNAAESPP